MFAVDDHIEFGYLMIFGKIGFAEQGIVGAAKATVIAQVVACGFYILLIFTRKNQRAYPAVLSLFLRRETPPAPIYPISLH